jgi:uncharacterized protein (TIGR02145 family)
LALVKAVGRDGKYGYIDKKGKYVISPVYDYAQDFSEGVAWVQIEDQSPTLIDKSGKIILQADSIIWAYPFFNGTAAVSYYSEGKEYGTFINKKGNPITPPIEGKFSPFLNDGLYAFQGKESRKWGFKNEKGEIVINEQFEDAGDTLYGFSDGTAEVKVGSKWGLINKKGQFVVNPQYDLFSRDGGGLYYVKVGKKYGWVNKKGEILINPQFDLAFPFLENKLTSVQMGRKWAYINKKGQIEINPQFAMALPFFKDYAAVVNDDGKMGFINQKGNYDIPPLYDINESEIIEEYVSVIFDFPARYYSDPSSVKFKFYARLNEKIEEYREKEREKARAVAEKERAIAEEKAEKARAEAKASTGSFTDSRDGTTYKTVKIGNQTWMAENLNYATGGKCYKDSPANCQKYGRHYNWAEAKNVCPSGWHLPSNAEWDALYKFADGNSDTESPYKSETAGKQLKAAEGWNPSNGMPGGGDDNYGFAAIPGGSNYLGKYDHLGNAGYWWSSSEYEEDSDKAYYRFMLWENIAAGWNKNSKKLLLNVRCVRD